MPVYWIQKETYKKLLLALGAGATVRNLMSELNVCKRIVMHICMLQYRQPLLVNIPDTPVPSRSEKSELLC